MAGASALLSLMIIGLFLVDEITARRLVEPTPAA